MLCCFQMIQVVDTIMYNTLQENIGTCNRTKTLAFALKHVGDLSYSYSIVPNIQGSIFQTVRKGLWEIRSSIPLENISECLGHTTNHNWLQSDLVRAGFRSLTPNVWVTEVSNAVQRRKSIPQAFLPGLKSLYMGKTSDWYRYYQSISLMLQPRSLASDSVYGLAWNWFLQVVGLLEHAIFRSWKASAELVGLESRIFGSW